MDYSLLVATNLKAFRDDRDWPLYDNDPQPEVAKRGVLERLKTGLKFFQTAIRVTPILTKPSTEVG